MGSTAVDEVVEGLGRLDASQVSLVADLVRVLGPVGAAADAEVPEVVLGALRVEAAVQGSAVGWVRRFDSSMGWVLDGARSPAGWLTARVPVSRPRAGAVVKRARDLAGMAVVAGSFGAGRIGPEQVRMLRDTRAEAPGVFAEQEAWLVGRVETLTVAATAVFLAGWLERALPDGGDDKALRDRFDTHLTMSETKGGTLVRAWLDKETAATITGALDAEIDAMRRAGLLEGDQRTRSQLLAEAWRTISARYGATGDQHGQPRPLALLLIDAATAAGRTPGRDERPAAGAQPAGRDTEAASPVGDGPGSDDGTGPASGLAPATEADVIEVDGSDGELDPGPAELRVSEIVGHGPVAGSTARRLLCDADVSEVTVTDHGRTVLDVGFTHRLATAAQRRALIVRSGGMCECPGCDAPYTWCQAHHLEPFDPVNHTGPTDLHNLAWLCHKHHHLVHEGGFHLIRGPTGTLQLHRRDGLRIDLPLKTRP